MSEPVEDVVIQEDINEPEEPAVPDSQIERSIEAFEKIKQTAISSKEKIKGNTELQLISKRFDRIIKNIDLVISNIQEDRDDVAARDNVKRLRDEIRFLNGEVTKQGLKQQQERSSNLENIIREEKRKADILKKQRAEQEVINKAARDALIPLTQAKKLGLKRNKKKDIIAEFRINRKGKRDTIKRFVVNTKKLNRLSKPKRKRIRKRVTRKTMRRLTKRQRDQNKLRKLRRQIKKLQKELKK